MMALDGLGSMGGMSGIAGIAAWDPAGAAPFRARPGMGKRLARLARDIRDVHSVRGKMSLVHAELRGGSRVRGLRQWFDAARGAAIGPADMRHLLGRLVPGASLPVQARVFARIAQAYCASAGIEHLAALRRRLPGAAPDADGRAGWTPASDAARAACATFRAMVDARLARDTLVMPLKQIVQALPATADARAVAFRDGTALDIACARLAASLHRAAYDGVAPALLAAALDQLSHAERRMLAQHLTPSRPDARRALDPADCTMSRALRRMQPSSDLWQRRLHLIGELQTAMQRVAGQRLDYFVHTTARLIDFRLAQGDRCQTVYELAFASLSRTLETVGDAGLLERGGPATLAPRLIAAALLGKPLKDVLAFVSRLDIPALGTLLLAMEGAAPEYAGAAALIRGVRDDKIRGYRDPLAGRLRDVQDALAAGRRWPIARRLHALARAVDAWQQNCAPGGQEIPHSIARDLHATVRKAMDALSLDPAGPVSVLGRASIEVLCGSEAECLRLAEPALQPYGLRLDRAALEAVAADRAGPHIAMTLEHLHALVDLLAQENAEPARIVQALRDGTECLAAACARYASFIDMSADDTLRLCTRIAGEAWRGFADRQPDRGAVARAALRSACPALDQALNDAAAPLIQDLDEDRPRDGDWGRDPATHAVRRLRLASHLMAAFGAVCRLDGEEAVGGADARPFDWSPPWCEAIAGQFGVYHDPRGGQAGLVMSPAQQDVFARLLLDDELAPDRIVDYSVSTAAGTVIVPIDAQLLMDGIQRTGSRFSVSGVDRDGRYVAYTDCTPLAGETSHVPGVERALLALHRLAGPDTPMLTTYLTQTASAGFMFGLSALGEQGPIRMDDGLAVMPGGLARTHADIRRMADGSYVLRINPVWYRLDTATASDGSSAVKLDPRRSFASLACDVRLSRGPDSRWRPDVVSPLMIRCHMVPADT
ncbi:hypothetical protein [Bordetella bronchialis]|nr:hypothetical protein [Bordetella bronchialis]